MFTAGNLILGSLAGLIVGLSKTALPGAALVATPMIAAIVSEYFAASTSGLGFGIKDNLRKAEMAMGWAYITVASVAGILLYLLLLAAERYLTRWHPSSSPKRTT